MKSSNIRLLWMLTILLGSMFSIVNAATSVSGGGSSSGTTVSGTNGSTIDVLTSQLCGIVGGVRTVIGVIALVMFLVGGVLYAVGHFMPAAGQVKASMQGWAMGMILGGVIGVILVILAPFIISTILNFGSGLSSLAC
ncbi:MAG: hypothetical protein KGH65_01595 [Candidatus Micrarchaeota archaeon]|nr:hypothetical protein [Candidatus Micrarchaeota archaeon]